MLQCEKMNMQFFLFSLPVYFAAHVRQRSLQFLYACCNFSSFDLKINGIQLSLSMFEEHFQLRYYYQILAIQWKMPNLNMQSFGDYTSVLMIINLSVPFYSFSCFLLWFKETKVTATDFLKSLHDDLKTEMKTLDKSLFVKNTKNGESIFKI